MKNLLNKLAKAAVVLTVGAALIGWIVAGGYGITTAAGEVVL